MNSKIGLLGIGKWEPNEFEDRLTRHYMRFIRPPTRVAPQPVDLGNVVMR